MVCLVPVLFPQVVKFSPVLSWSFSYLLVSLFFCCYCAFPFSLFVFKLVHVLDERIPVFPRWLRFHMCLVFVCFVCLRFFSIILFLFSFPSQHTRWTHVCSFPANYVFTCVVLVFPSFVCFLFYLWMIFLFFFFSLLFTFLKSAYITSDRTHTSSFPPDCAFTCVELDFIIVYSFVYFFVNLLLHLIALSPVLVGLLHYCLLIVNLNFFPFFLSFSSISI